MSWLAKCVMGFVLAAIAATAAVEARLEHFPQCFALLWCFHGARENDDNESGCPDWSTENCRYDVGDDTTYGIPNAIRECIDDPPVTDPDLVRRTHAPTLIIAQDNDLLHDSSIARELAELLPNAELHVFDDQFGLLREVPTLVQRSAALLSS